MSVAGCVAGGAADPPAGVGAANGVWAQRHIAEPLTNGGCGKVWGGNVEMRTQCMINDGTIEDDEDRAGQGN